MTSLENKPSLWASHFPRRTPDSHKYDFGHALIVGAPKLTGATRLAAESCARIGAGLTTVLADKQSAAIYRASLPAHIMVEDSGSDFNKHLADPRRNAVLIGPGGGTDFTGLRRKIKITGKAGKPVVIDADALNALAPLKLKFTGTTIMTPHEGEFAKLFPHLKGSRAERAAEAAKISNAVIVLKGHDTVIAAPDSRVAINNNAPPFLATAGTGDVLAGMITGLLAQGMEPFDSACAAAWVHGEAAGLFGPGLVAGDLPGLIPHILRIFI